MLAGLIGILCLSNQNLEAQIVIGGGVGSGGGGGGNPFNQDLNTTDNVQFISTFNHGGEPTERAWERGLFQGQTYSAGFSFDWGFTGTPSADYLIGATSNIQVSVTDALGFGIVSILDTETSFAGNVATLVGNYVEVAHRGTGTLTSLKGYEVYAYHNDAAGTTTEIVGVDVFKWGNGLPSGTATTSSGIYIREPRNISGTVYGLRIGTTAGHASGSAYNLYSEGSTAQNIFEGLINGRILSLNVGTINTPGATETIDFATASARQIVNLDDDTVFTLSNIPPGATVTIDFNQGVTGGFEPTFTNTIYWSGGLAPTFNTASGDIDTCSFYNNGSILKGQCSYYAIP